MTTSEIDLSCAVWRTASKDADTCVEVARVPTVIAVRDSKDPAGPVLAFTPDRWRFFTDAVKNV